MPPAMGTRVSLRELADLAIGTPEVGAVNFTALHTLIVAILKNLKLQETVIDLQALSPETGRSLESLRTGISAGPLPAPLPAPKEKERDREKRRSARAPQAQALESQMQDLNKQVKTMDSKIHTIITHVQSITSQTSGLYQDTPEWLEEKEMATPVSERAQITSTTILKDPGPPTVPRAMRMLQDVIDDVKSLKETQQKMQELTELKPQEVLQRIEDLERVVRDRDEFLEHISVKLGVVPGGEEVTMVTWEELEQAITDGWRASQGSTDLPPPLSKRKAPSSLTSNEITSGVSTKQPSTDQSQDFSGGLDQTLLESGGPEHLVEGITPRERTKGPSAARFPREQRPRARDEASTSRTQQPPAPQLRAEPERRRGKNSLTTTQARRDERDTTQQDLPSPRDRHVYAHPEQQRGAPAGHGQVHPRPDQHGVGPPGMDQPGFPYPGAHPHPVVPHHVGQLGVLPPEMDSQGSVPLGMDQRGVGRDQQGLELPGTEQPGMVPQGTLLPGTDQYGMEWPGVYETGMGPLGLDQQGLTPLGTDQQGPLPPGMDQQGLVSPAVMQVSADQQGSAQPTREAAGFTQPGSEQHDLTQPRGVQPVSDHRGLVQSRLGRRTLARPRSGQRGVVPPGLVPPGAGQPGLVQPGAGQPGLVQPGIYPPSLAQLVVDQHGFDQGSWIQPGAYPPYLVQPGIIQQSLVQPGAVQQGLVQPGAVQQGLVQPGAVQQGLVQPGAIQQGLVQPGAVQQGLVQPGADQQGLVQPGVVQHDLMQPGAYPPYLVQPGAVQQGLVQPGADQQGLVQPGADQQGLVQPGADQQGLVQPGAVPQGLVQPGAVPQGLVQPGAVPQGLVQPGAVQQGLVRPGAVPQGLVRPGAVPQGLVRPGSYPPYLVQPGVIQQGILVPPGMDQYGLAQSGTDEPGGLVPPSAGQHGLVQPGMGQHGLAQPGADQPGVVQPGMDQRGLVQPGADQPGLVQPGEGQPGLVQPGTYQPGGLEQSGADQGVSVPPGMDQYGLAQPGTDQHGLVQPGIYPHGLVQPGIYPHGLVQPGMYPRGLVQPGMYPRGLVQPGMYPRGLVQPGMYPRGLVQPGAGRRGLVQPGAGRRGVVQPGAGRRGVVQPGADEHGLVQPGADERGLVQPGADERGLVQPGADERGLVQPGADERGLVQPGADERGLVQPGMDQSGLVQPGADQFGTEQPGVGHHVFLQPSARVQGMAQPGIYTPGSAPPGAYPGLVQPGAYPPGLVQLGTYPPGLVQPGVDPRASMIAPGSELPGFPPFLPGSQGLVAPHLYQQGVVPPSQEQRSRLLPLRAFRNLRSPSISQRSFVPSETVQQRLRPKSPTRLESTYTQTAPPEPDQQGQDHPDAGQLGRADSILDYSGPERPGDGSPEYPSVDLRGQVRLRTSRTSDQLEHLAQPDEDLETASFTGSRDSLTLLRRVSSERSDSLSDTQSQPYGLKQAPSFPIALETFRLVGEMVGLYVELKENIKDLDPEQAGQTDLEKLQYLLGMMVKKIIPPDLQEQLKLLRNLAKEVRQDRAKVERIQRLLEGDDREGGKELKTGQLGLQLGILRATVSDIEKELAELRDSQEQGKASMENSVVEASLYLQDQLDKLRTIIENMLTSSSTLLSMSMRPHKILSSVAPGQIDPEATCPACSLDLGHQVSTLVQRYEQLQDMVNSLAASRPSKRAKLQSQDEELLGHVQSAILQVQGDCEKLNVTTANLIEDHRQKQKDIDVLYQGLEKLEREKANREHLELEIDVKADKSALAAKVSRVQFDATTEQLNHMMKELVAKMSGQEQDWQKMLDRLLAEMDSKLDRLELDPVKQSLEDRWKSLRQQLKERSPLYQADEAAIMRRQLLAHFHCLSCDRPLETPVTGQMINVTPVGPSLPGHRSIRPYTVFELEQVRQHSRNLRLGSTFSRGDLSQMERSVGRLRTMHSKMLMDIEKVQIHFGGSVKASSQMIHELLHSQCLSSPCYKRVPDAMVDYSFSSVPRRCGGSHTLTYPYRRNRLQHLSQGPYSPEEIQIAMKHDEVDILGLDGHIYKGRMDTRLPGILTKDAPGMMKPKSKQSRPNMQRTQALGRQPPSRPQSARISVDDSSVSSRQQKDRPVSSEGRLSQSAHLATPVDMSTLQGGPPLGEGPEVPTRGPRSNTAP